MISILVATIVWIVYCIASCVKYGVPKSLSDTYYTPIGRRYLPLTLGVVVISLLPPSLDLVVPQAQWAVFLALGGLAFVVATPKSRDDYQGKIHLGAAIISAICTQVVVAIHTPQLLWVWLPASGLLLLKHGRIFWIEMLCFVTCISTLLTIA